MNLTMLPVVRAKWKPESLMEFQMLLVKQIITTLCNDIDLLATYTNIDINDINEKVNDVTSRASSVLMGAAEKCNFITADQSTLSGCSV